MKPTFIFKHFTFLAILAAFFPVQLNAQNISGTWEGYIRDEFLQINIQQNGTTLCGFTYDYVILNRENHCRAYYAGKYEDGFVLFTGTSFIENSGSHVLMTIGLLTDYIDGKLVLRGRVDTHTVDDAYITDKSDEIIVLRRTSPFPQNVPGTTQPCYNTPPEKKTDIKSQGKPSVPKPVNPKPAPIVPKPDPVKSKPADPEPVKPKPEVIIPKVTVPADLPARIKERKQDEQGRITVNVKTINLKIYDNGVVDGDTVSVYYNGKLIVDKQRLSEKPIEINLTLDDNIDLQQLTLFAENLGSFPPNTALIVVTAGSKRFELRSDADLKKNAVLIFKYEPQ